MNRHRDTFAPSGRVPWMLLLRITVLSLVIYFIVQAVRQSQSEFESVNFQISDIRWPWLLLAATAYLLGMLPMGLNWHRLLVAMGQPVPRWHAVRTHYISLLGKYVPGKACVPAIRLGLLARYQLHVATALVSMFAETLAMMSVGAVVGGCILAVQYRSRPDVALVAAGLALAAGLPVIPPVLRAMLRFVARRRELTANESGTDPAADLTWAVLLPGWLGITLGWLLFGVSMWATLRALDLPSTRNVPIADLPQVTASYSISVVAGFMSMLPGGVFVREWVMKELIEPSYGTMAALLAPVLHRMVSLVSELIISGMLYFTSRRSSV